MGGASSKPRVALSDPLAVSPFPVKQMRFLRREQRRGDFNTKGQRQHSERRVG